VVEQRPAGEQEEGVAQPVQVRRRTEEKASGTQELSQAAEGGVTRYGQVLDHLGEEDRVELTTLGWILQGHFSLEGIDTVGPKTGEAAVIDVGRDNAARSTATRQGRPSGHRRCRAHRQGAPEHAVRSGAASPGTRAVARVVLRLPLSADAGHDLLEGSVEAGLVETAHGHLPATAVEGTLERACRRTSSEVPDLAEIITAISWGDNARTNSSAAPRAIGVVSQ
jgi:hypothetical protein